MPSNSAEYQREYQRQYRSLRKVERKVDAAMLLKLIEEIRSLRKALQKTRKEPIRPPIKNLSSSSESKNLKKDRESEQARIARLTAWLPNEEHEKLAAEQGHGLDWLSTQAELYRCQQQNTKTRHKNFAIGFRAWVLRAQQFQGKPNGQGHQLPSAVDNLYAGAWDAVRELDRREQEANRNPNRGPDGTLLDS